MYMLFSDVTDVFKLLCRKMCVKNNLGDAVVVAVTDLCDAVVVAVTNLCDAVVVEVEDTRQTELRAAEDGDHLEDLVVDRRLHELVLGSAAAAPEVDAAHVAADQQRHECTYSR